MIKTHKQASDTEKKQIAYLLGQSSENKERVYAYTENQKDGFSRKYNYWKEEIKTDCYVKGFFGQPSDCYILYAICILGACTRDNIATFLNAYTRAHKNLQIPKELLTLGKKISSLHARLNELVKYGEVIRFSYRAGTEEITLFCISKDGQMLMNKVLGKRTPLNPWEVAAPVLEIMATGAVAFTTCEIIKNCGTLVKLKEEPLKTPSLGTEILPPVIHCDNANGRQIVLTYPAYLRLIPDYQTKDDFGQYALHKIEVLNNFLYHYTASRHASSDETPYVVLVAEDGEDIEKIGILIRESSLLGKHGHLERIYVTSEGMLRTVKKTKDAFLQYVTEQDGEITVRKSIPPFTL